MIAMIIENLCNKRFKAQFWSFDVIFAMVIFTIALTILGFTWYSVNNELALSYGSGAILAQLETHTLAQNIMSTGYPTSWFSVVNTSNTFTWSNVSIGLSLAPSSSNLSINKIYALSAMSSNNYQATKQDLGVGYDYYVTIVGGSYNISIGRNPSTNKALTVYVERRSALLQGTPVIVQAIVWTNTSLAIS
jgi:hypothetical protein